MYICVQAPTHVYSCVYMYIHKGTHLHMHIHKHRYTYINIHTYICLCVHFKCTHTYICIYTYTCISNILTINHTYIQIQIGSIYKLFTYKVINLSNNNLHQCNSILNWIVWNIINNILYLEMNRRNILSNCMFNDYIFEPHNLVQF